MCVKFCKVLTKNDCGVTGAHQSGLHISKREHSLLAVLPMLDSLSKNPDTELQCFDEKLGSFAFRFVHYNNRHHSQKGTRDEFRITRISRYLRLADAVPGDIFHISRRNSDSNYDIGITKNSRQAVELDIVVKLVGWRQDSKLL